MLVLAGVCAFDVGWRVNLGVNLVVRNVALVQGISGPENVDIRVDNEGLVDGLGDCAN